MFLELWNLCNSVQLFNRKAFLHLSIIYMICIFFFLMVCKKQHRGKVHILAGTDKRKKWLSAYFLIPLRHVYKRQCVKQSDSGLSSYSALLAACDYLGERLASLLSITSAKYQYAFDEYSRSKGEVRQSTYCNSLYVKDRFIKSIWHFYCCQ